MYIVCRCGHRIHDNTDRIPYKGRIIADQDWFDFLDRIEMALQSNAGRKELCMNDYMDIVHYADTCIYQCTCCGRLYLDDGQGGFDTFIPEGEVQHSLLESCLGEKWKGALCAFWIEPCPDWMEHSGLISPEVNAPYDAMYFDDRTELERAYHALFEELRAKGIIRSAFLEINHQKVHSWNES